MTIKDDPLLAQGVRGTVGPRCLAGEASVRSPERGTVVAVSTHLLEELLFGYARTPVRVLSIHPKDNYGGYDIEIEGPDVPKVPRVVCLCEVQSNRAGQKLMTMKFEPTDFPG